MADPNDLATTLAAALQPAMVAMAAAIAGALQPRLGPASGGPIDVDAAPGADNSSGAAPAAAALAAAPGGRGGRSRSSPKRDQPLPPAKAEAQRIEALARQVKELQQRLDLAYAELSEYRRGGHHQGGPERRARRPKAAPSAAHRAAPRAAAT